MKYKYEIYDNFLDKESFNKIYVLLMGDNFPWFYNSSKILIDENLTKNQNIDVFYNFQFVHNFYKDYAPRSAHYDLLIPLIEKINPSSLLRIKGNLTTRTKEIVEYGNHRDYEIKNESLKTAVFYINTNNGYTLFENGDKVDSVENRLVIFDTPMLHTGTSCTDEKTRVLLNFNFYL